MPEPATAPTLPEQFDGVGCPYCGPLVGVWTSDIQSLGDGYQYRRHCDECDRSWTENYYLMSTTDDTGAEAFYPEEYQRRAIERQLVTVAQQAQALIERYDQHEYYATDYPSPSDAQHLLALLTSALSAAEEARIGQ
jgi:hypothetical protein